MTASPSIADGTFPSTCWECGTICGSLVTVKDGQVAKVGPNPDHPATRGAFCVKGILGAPGWTTHPSRLTQPLRRVGTRGEGRWEPLGWDDALDVMADGLASVRERFGPLAIAGAVSGAFFSRGLTVALLMRSLGSPNWLINQDLCGGCRALSDRLTGLAIDRGEDIDATRCALVVGRNPSAADPAQWQALRRARAKGARIIAIDPKRIPVADIADLWLRVRPGTDAALALAMIHVLVTEGRHDREFVARWTHGFDALAARAAQYPPEVAARLTGVAADDIVRAARMYADGPSTFVSGHGIDAFSAGVQTFRAYHGLVAISGNLDREGGNRRVKRPAGYRTYLDLLHHPDFRLPREVEERTIGADRFPLWAGPRGWQMACHNPSVIDAILTGEPYPIRAMYVSGVNVVVTYPNARKTARALASLDFLAVASQTMTPTAELADLVLPKTTTLEEEEVSLNPAGPCVTYTRAAVPPRGQARCDLDIAVGLLDRLEARGAIAKNFFRWRTQREFCDFLLADTTISLDDLRTRGFATYPYRLGNFDEQGFNTPTGKIELFSTTLDGLGLDPLPDFVTPAAEREGHDAGAYPLVLLTGDREKAYHHSRFREQAWARRMSPDPELRVHPETAAAHGIARGDWVWVETSGGPGRCRLRVELTEATPPGVVSTGMGWWFPDAPVPDHGAFDVNVNAAMSYDGPWDPVSGSADTRGLRCRLVPVPAA
ncbi:MAG: molybdopterin-dependent oxidoreductase [Candidatus Rokubacteria bacterium]|nr:molybdopterin-dependent oxidoreductase [Candidatus Rokubacteria bacterium]